ncbi:MAG: alpha/beta fold hydrolase [Rubrivivax sp.]|nr:alpha/beta fold hydrolase [Rubrivivax sp.]
MSSAASASASASAAAAALQRPGPFERVLRSAGLELPELAQLAGPLGVTPRETVLAIGALKLHRYRPLADSVYRTPLLVVTSLVNQPYILDLVPGQSMVEHLLRQGYDVFLVEWGRVRSEHAGLTLEDHVLDRLPRCVERVLQLTGERELTMLGYCVGGLLAVLYAALHPGAPLRNFVAMATPVDSQGLAALRTWMGEGFDADGLLAQYGNVPGEWVQNSLRALKPLGKLAGAMNFLNNVQHRDAVASHLRMGKWETDNLPFPGGVFRQMVRDFLRGNRLVQGGWQIGGRVADPALITQPFLHLLAQEDHITPYAAAHPLLGMVGSVDKQEIVLKGGHVGLVAGRGAQTRMWPALDAWLAPRSE